MMIAVASQEEEERTKVQGVKHGIYIKLNCYRV